MRTKRFYRNWLIVVLGSLYVVMFWWLPLYVEDVPYLSAVIKVHFGVICILGIVFLTAHLFWKYLETD
jgi:hypothetical protein